MNISCKNCGESVDLTDKDFADLTCGHCREKIPTDYIADVLEDPAAEREKSHGDESFKRGCCHECGMIESVVKTVDAVLICSNCGLQHDEYKTCSRCGHNNTGDMSESSIWGCPVCEEAIQTRLDRQ